MLKKLMFSYLLSIMFLLPAVCVKEETGLQRLAKSIVSSSNSNDLRMDKIEKWVIQNINYKSDIKQFNMMERWTLPTETLQRRSGDCEDGSILLIALATAAGISPERLRLYVPIRVPSGWHACAAYRRENDEKWVWMEWAWKRNSAFLPVERRKTIDEVPAYSRLGTYLSVSSLNPFNMEWGKD
ncbi:MAG: transglutaminase family protein [Deltaproteobacteria bacterium]|nr:transglutaminase family protein [Deltaproteobacteria bacterium]